MEITAFFDSHMDRMTDIRADSICWMDQLCLGTKSRELLVIEKFLHQSEDHSLV